MNWDIPNALWLAAPKDVHFWMGVHPPDDPEDVINECPGHGYVVDDTGDMEYCDGSCVEEEAHARLMAGLRGIDLNDRYPKGDEDGIIRTTSFDRD